MREDRKRKKTQEELLAMHNEKPKNYKTKVGKRRKETKGNKKKGGQGFVKVIRSRVRTSRRRTHDDKPSPMTTYNMYNQDSDQENPSDSV